MKTKSWSSLLMAAFAALYLWSFDDCGQMDPLAGNQVFPRLELKGELKFEEELAPEGVLLKAYDNGQVLKIVTHDAKGKLLQLSYRSFAECINLAATSYRNSSLLNQQS